jgi:predicted glycosyltransferase involved in capsule biosynthesis
VRKLPARRWKGARGSNMAFWRTDLDAVDGFDAGFEGWGREDSDIFIRLIRAGVRRKDGRFATGVLHLWHREADRSGLGANERQLADVMQSDSVKARRGLSSSGAAAAPGVLASGAGR